MESIKQIVTDTLAEGFTSANVSYVITQNERTIIIGFLVSILLRLVWYVTEKNILKLKILFHNGKYNAHGYSDAARHATKDWKANKSY